MKKSTKQVVTRVVLCIILLITLLTSTLTAFATTTETTGSQETQTDTSVPAGLDLSKFTDLNFKDVAGVYNDCLCIKDDYDFFLLYADSESYYVWVVNEDTGENFFESISVDQANTYINDVEYYNASIGYREGYAIVGEIPYLDDSSKGKKVYILLSDGENLYNLGLYNSYKDLEELSKLDLSLKLPELNVKVNKEETTADLIVNFSCKSGVSSIICRDSDGKIVDHYVVPDEDYTSGACIFTVGYNETYTIEGYNDYYVSQDEAHTSVEVVIDGLVRGTAEPVSSEGLDTKGPKITFSKIPDTASKNTEIELTMYSDEPAKLVFNGITSDGYVNEMKVTIYGNGVYYYSGSDKNSNLTDGSLNIDLYKEKEMNTVNSENRDSFWGDATDIVSNTLPRTGSIGWYVLIIIGVAIMGTGAFLIVRGTKKKATSCSTSED